MLAPPGESGATRNRRAADPHPTPAEAAEFADFFTQALAGLDDEERRVVDFKLADQRGGRGALGSSERTVRRILKRVQSRLTRVLDGA